MLVGVLFCFSVLSSAADLGDRRASSSHWKMATAVVKLDDGAEGLEGEFDLFTSTAERMLLQLPVTYGSGQSTPSDVGPPSIFYDYVYSSAVFNCVFLLVGPVLSF